jgi:exodeoxyribonuclease V gamma subunit
VRPGRAVLAQSLGLRLADEVEEVDDLEPLVLSSRGPEKRSVQAAVVRATLNGDTEPLYPRLRARPAAVRALGERQFEVEQLKTRPYASALLGWMQGEPLESRRYEVDIDGVRLHGRVADRHPEGWCACALAPSMAMR